MRLVIVSYNYTNFFSLFFQSHPTHAHFRTETSPDYEDLKIAVGNGTATGMGSLSLGDDTDATTYEGEDDRSWGIDGLIFDQNTHSFVQNDNESFDQESSPSFSEQPSRGSNADAPPQNRAQDAPPHNRAQGKRSRTDYEKASGTKGATNQAQVLENLSTGIGKIVTSFDTICGLMEKRQSLF